MANNLWSFLVKNLAWAPCFLLLGCHAPAPEVLKQDNAITTAFQSPETEQVLVLFTMNDCPLCLYETEHWATAAANGLPLVGLTPEADQDKLDAFLADYNATFPVIRDPDLFASLMNHLESSDLKPRTPAKIFLDRNRRIMAIEYGVKDLEKQSQFPERALSILSGDI